MLIYVNSDYMIKVAAILLGSKLNSSFLNGLLYFNDNVFQLGIESNVSEAVV